jgi:hypothetical protein
VSPHALASLPPDAATVTGTVRAVADAVAPQLPVPAAGCSMVSNYSSHSYITSIALQSTECNPRFKCFNAWQAVRHWNCSPLVYQGCLGRTLKDHCYSAHLVLPPSSPRHLVTRMYVQIIERIMDGKGQIIERIAPSPHTCI